MAITRQHKNKRTLRDKEHPHYNFLYSWQPTEAHVKRESGLENKTNSVRLSASKKAEIQAKDETQGRIKKDIFRSLILISFILILELVVYLAWIKFGLS